MHKRSLYSERSCNGCVELAFDDYGRIGQACDGGEHDDRNKNGKSNEPFNGRQEDERQRDGSEDGFRLDGRHEHADRSQDVDGIDTNSLLRDLSPAAFAAAFSRFFGEVARALVAGKVIAPYW